MSETSAIYHRQDNTWRVMCRGRYWYLQQHCNVQGSKTFDPWNEGGPRYENRTGALIAMYSRVPLIQKAA